MLLPEGFEVNLTKRDFARGLNCVFSDTAACIVVGVVPPPPRKVLRGS